MAKNKETEPIEKVEESTGARQEAKTKPKKDPEPIYPIEELIEGYKAFNASKPIVITALKLAEITEATFDQAKEIVDNFKNKEV